MANNTAETYTDEAPKAKGGLSSRVIFLAVRRRPLAFVGIICLAAIVAAGVWLFLPLPKNTSAVVFHVATQPQTLLAGSENRVDSTSYKQSQIALIKSRRTLMAALKEPQVRDLGIIAEARPDELTWLDKYLTVDAKNASEYVRVTIEGDNAEELLTLMSAVTKSYLAASLERDSGARRRKQEELESSYFKAREELKKYHVKIDEIAVSLGSKEGVDLHFFDQIRQTNLARALDEHRTLSAELDIAKAGVEEAKKSLARKTYPAVAGAFWLATLPPSELLPSRVIPLALIEEELRKDSILQGLENDVKRAQKALSDTEDLLDKNLDKNPAAEGTLKVARANLKAAEVKRDKYRVEAKERVESQLKERWTELEDFRSSTAQGEFERAHARVERAWANVHRLQGEISKANTYKSDLQNLKTDIAQKEKVTAQLADEIERMKIELKTPPRVSLAEEPYVVPGIEGNRRLKATLLATLGVLLLGFAGLVGWEFRGRRVLHADEVSTRLGTRLIGTIPPFPTASQVTDPDAHGPLVEAIDTTRIMLTHGTPGGQKLRVLMVTSAVSGEGKSTLSGHLAISLSRAGFRTLLVDGDMYAPSVQSVFGFANAPGLGEALRGEASVTASIRQTPVANLSVLPAGEWTAATHRYLVGDRFAVVKRELVAGYDFVVIDTPPLLMVSDTMLIARQADAVLVSVLLGVSQTGRVEETLNRLRAVGAEVAGVVVNNVPSVVSRRYASRPKAAVVPDYELPEALPVAEE